MISIYSDRRWVCVFLTTQNIAMKAILPYLLCFFLLGCANDDQFNNCNFLLEVGVAANLNLNLPQYSPLLVTGNSVYVQNQGNLGIIVVNTGLGRYRAWDAADPNHVPTSCSLLQINGLEATCGCDDQNKYELITGQSVGNPLPCILKEYRVSVSGSNILVNN